MKINVFLKNGKTYTFEKAKEININESHDFITIYNDCGLNGVVRKGDLQILMVDEEQEKDV